MRACKGWMAALLLGVAGAASAHTALLATPSGVLAGVKRDGVAIYLGIPYAAPPVGTLRWRAAQAMPPWDGIRSAVEYGPLCPQNLDIVVGARPRMAEDCLTLNVWTPARKPEKPLPVIVWLHGGGYFQGSASQWPTDGSALARRGVVVVSVNFRLGALGFLAHPALSEEAEKHGEGRRSGNYGLQDQIAALRWVQAEIARYGGDPGNVTVMGQSSGATTVTALMTSPVARGLFHKAILMSGGAPARLRRLDEPVGDWASMERLGETLAAGLAIASGETLLRLLRGAPWQTLDAAWRDALSRYKGDGTWHHLIVDGETLAAVPADVFQAGKQHALPMLIGVTADEGSWFAERAGLASRRAFVAYASEIHGSGRVRELLKKYAPRARTRHDWLAAARRLIGDQFTETLHATASAQRRVHTDVYAYEFRRARIPPGPRAGLGDYHSAELPYVFDQLPSELGNDAYHHALADELAARWVEFARSGQPNPAGWPRWQTYDPVVKKHNSPSGPTSGLAQ